MAARGLRVAIGYGDRYCGTSSLLGVRWKEDGSDGLSLRQGDREPSDAAGFDSKNGLVFSLNGDGTLTVIDTKDAGYKVVQTLATQKGARTMAFDSGNGRVYLVTAEMGPRPAATEANPRPRPPVL